MEKRQLGRTGHMSSVVIFGAAALSQVDQETADEALDEMLAYGVNHIDVAPSYGHAEERIGRWLPPHRDKFFLGCKTLERERDAAWAELHRSLEKLQTDHFELYQFHAIGTFEELDKAMKPGGAIETLVRARDEGLTRFLGITGHGIQTPAVHAAALERFDLDTVMFPIHPRLYADANYRRDTERLLDMCIQRGVGAMIIKSVTRGPWGALDKSYSTWYQPYDQQKAIEQGVRFVLSQSGVTGIPSAGDVRLLPMVLEAGKRFQPMSQEEQAALIQESAALEPLFT
jgi:predicted aldo/keto reductase-like oxidoreductase